MRDFTKKILLSVFTFFAAILAVETALRIGGYRPSLLHKAHENPAISYVHTPGYSEGFVSINPLGLRDEAFPAAKPAGEFRIIILGDSLVMGAAAPSDATFVKILGRRLSEKYPRKNIRVINAGTAGYSTTQEMAFLKEYLVGLKPDAVILSYCLNDPEPVGTLIGRRSRFLRRIKNTLRYNVRVIYWFFERYYKFSIARRFAREADKKEGYDYVLSLHERNSSAWKGVETAFREFRSLAVAHGFRAMVFINPSLDKGALGAGYPYAAVHSQVASAARAAGLEVFDLLRPLSGEDPVAIRVSPTDGHYNGRGHELVGRLLFEELSSRGVVK